MATAYVHHGISSYVDYDRSWPTQRQWLVSDRWATIWSNILAIFLTAATARCFPILQRIFSVLWPPKSKDTGTDNLGMNQLATQSPGGAVAAGAPSTGSPASVASQNSPVAASQATHAEQQHEQPDHAISTRINAQHSTGGAGLDFLVNAVATAIPGTSLPTDQRPPFRPAVYLRDIRQNLKDHFREIALGLSLGIGLISLQAGFLAVSIFSGLVVSDSIALSRSPQCGLILPKPGNQSTIVNDKWTKRYQDLEVESLEYAKRCYAANARSEECSYFYNQSIHFSVKHNTTCPFGGDVCLYGPTGAFTLTTGPISPKAIGINTRLRYRFERTTTCSPLKMDEDRFVQRYFMEGKHLYRYFLGGFSTKNAPCGSAYSNCTWNLPIEITSKPMYRVFGISKGPFAADAGWQPIPELEPTDGGSVAVLLVGNTAISYPTASHDPIFHAEAHLSDGRFYNEHAYSAAMACSDRTTYCEPDGDFCGSVIDMAPRIQDDDEHHRVFTMLANSLTYSDTGNAVKHIGGEALDAQSYIVGTGSLILASEQWKVEAERLFASSLARIQITARNIARGIGGEQLPGQDLMNDRSGWRDICYIYKFRSSGWKNLSVTGFIGSFLAGSLLMILSIERKKPHELWFEAYLRALYRRCPGWYRSTTSALKDAWIATRDRPKSWNFDPRQWDLLARVCGRRPRGGHPSGTRSRHGPNTWHLDPRQWHLGSRVRGRHPPGTATR